MAIPLYVGCIHNILWGCNLDSEITYLKDQLWAQLHDAQESNSVADLMNDEDYVATLEEKAGRTFRQYLKQSKDRRHRFALENIEGDYSDFELGRMIINNEGISSDEARVTQDRQLNNFIDLSIPADHPDMCNVLLERLGRREGVKEPYWAVTDNRGRQHQVEVQSIGETVDVTFPYSTVPNKPHQFKRDEVLLIDGTMTSNIKRLDKSLKALEPRRQQVLTY